MTTETPSALRPAITVDASDPDSRSRTSRTIRRPSMPPSALTKSAAAWTPVSSCFAKPAALPTSGKAAPTRIAAGADKADADGSRAGEAHATSAETVTPARSGSVRRRDDRCVEWRDMLTPRTLGDRTPIGELLLIDDHRGGSRPASLSTGAAGGLAAQRDLEPVGDAE